MVPRFRSLSAFLRFRNTWVREAQPYLAGPERDDLEQRMLDCFGIYHIGRSALTFGSCP